MPYATAIGFPPLCARGRKRPERVRLPPFTLAHATWPALWREVVEVLQGHGYARATILFYRQIIRAFSRHAGKPPCRITPVDVKAYLGTLTADRCTWHWAAMNLSVLRTVFDKLGGLNALVHRRGPRRKRRIPEYLEPDDIARLLDASTCLRDQVVMSLLYGCGLKTGELRRVIWADIHPDRGTVRVPSRWGRPDRELPLPRAILPLLAEGKQRCPAEAPVCADPSGRRALGARRIQLIVREAAERAGIERTVLPVILRHSYAVHFLRQGGTIRQLQDNLDHRLLEATARYLDFAPLPDPRIPTVNPKTPATRRPGFVREITDRFTSRIRGLRLFHDSA